MMNRDYRVVSRTVFCNLKMTAGVIVLLSLTSFLLVYLYARSTSYGWEPAKLFTSYLGGFRRTNIFAVIWTVVHIPIRVFLVGQIVDTFNRTYPVRVLKYRSKMIFCCTTIAILTIETMIYYAVGYGVLIAFTNGQGLVSALWQAGLSCVEALNFICSVFLFGRFFHSWENLAFPVILVIELLNTLLCGAKGGNTRFLPFTQGKMIVQEEYFFNGMAMIAAFILLGCLILVTAVFWTRKDERNEL